jgi:YD repeat-containing protein
LVLCLFATSPVLAQGTTYHLHKNTVGGDRVLSTAGPDESALAFQTTDFKGVADGTVKLVQPFRSASLGGTTVFPAGTLLNFRLWMRKTANWGVLRGRARLSAYNYSPPASSLFCEADTANLTTTTAPYNFSCQTSSAISITPTYGLYLTVSVVAVTGPGGHTVKGELSVEGTPDGNYDSQVTITPPPAPSVTSLTPSFGPVGTSLTIAGANFGASQGSSTVTFHGIGAAPTSWSATSIEASVPTTAISGPVVVTVSGQTSNNDVTFTVPPPAITGLDPTEGPVGTSVTIAGSGFGPFQPSNTVSFNGVAAPITNWTPTGIVAAVPDATTGPVIVTVNGRSSNSATFTVVTTGTMSGVVTRANDASPLSGASIQLLLNGVSQGSTSTATDGSYSVPDLTPGPYDVRVTKSGFSPELRTDVPVVVAQTTTLNLSLSVPGSIAGRITQSDGTTPLAGAAVTVFDGPSDVGHTSTSDTGDYIVPNLHPGTYLVQAAYVGYQTKEDTSTVTDGTEATVNMSLTAAPVGPVTYAYDELNRLVSVVDASGASATYTYDAVGNILSIARHGTGSVSVSEFTPNSGPIGQAVTVFGTGFSTTTTENTVRFNGTAATVTSATTTSLVTTVPAGATTGPISVTTAAGAASSTAPFTVTADTGAPTMSGFTPTLASEGATVTISGTNFDTSPGNNVVTINLTSVQPTVATTTQLQAAVPAPVATGRVSVQTALGTATSSTYLWVPPPPYLSTDVESTGTMTLDTATGISVSAAGKIAIRAFEGAAGQTVSFEVSGSTAGATTFSVYSPYAGLISTGTMTNGFVDSAVLPATGTYTFVMDPSGTQVGGATVMLHTLASATGSITADGTPVMISLPSPGQNGFVTFTGAAGQQVSVVATNVTLPATCAGSWTLAILQPQVGGTFSTLASIQPCYSTSGFLDTITLPVSGTYMLRLDPLGTATGNATLALYTVVPVTGSITTDGTAVAISLPTPGQNGYLTFTGTAGQQVSALATNVTVPQACAGSWVFAITKPDGSTLTSTQPCWSSSGFLDSVTLPVTGTYTVRFDPVGTPTGNATLAVYTITDVTGSIATDGTPATVSLPTVGQKASLTFIGTAGQQVSALATNVTVPQACAGSWVLAVVKPDGSTLSSIQPCWSSSGFLDTVTLPVSGTYTLRFDPVGTATGNAMLALYTVVHVTGSITANGSPVPVSLSTFGQNAYVTFTGTTGQQVTASTSNVTVPQACAGSWVFAIVKPDGSTLSSVQPCWSSGTSIGPLTLPFSGTYTLRFDPVGTATGNATFTLATAP